MGRWMDLRCMCGEYVYVCSRRRGPSSRHMYMYTVERYLGTYVGYVCISSCLHTYISPRSETAVAMYVTYPHIHPRRHTYFQRVHYTYVFVHIPFHLGSRHDVTHPLTPTYTHTSTPLISHKLHDVPIHTYAGRATSYSATRHVRRYVNHTHIQT